MFIEDIEKEIDKNRTLLLQLIEKLGFKLWEQFEDYEIVTPEEYIQKENDSSEAFNKSMKKLKEWNKIRKNLGKVKKL